MRTPEALSLSADILSSSCNREAKAVAVDERHLDDPPEDRELDFLGEVELMRPRSRHVQLRLREIKTPEVPTLCLDLAL